MSQPEDIAADFWRSWFSPEGFTKEKRQYRLLKMLPSSPRCHFCGAPFHGMGGTLVRLALSKKPSSVNPRFCNVCDEFARQHPGGAEVAMSMLFADVRGSTRLSEQMSPTAFSKIINRFYVEATEVLIPTFALIDKLAGDAVAAFWGEGFAGPDYVRVTIKAAQKILQVTGHGDPEGPWVPVGIGVHTGVAFVGAMGQPDGMVDITAVGEQVNLAARLASQAAIGEIIVSGAAMEAAGIPTGGAKTRQLELKGLENPVDVFVLGVAGTDRP